MVINIGAGGASFVQTKHVAPVSGPQSVLVRSMGETEVVLRRLRETTNVIYDVETTGLSWQTDKIVGHVLTFGPRPEDTYYVPVRHGPFFLGGNILEHPGLDHPFEVALNKITSTRRDLHVVGHHFMFDLLFCYSHGINWLGTMEDTEVNDALLDELAPSHSLESCCIRAGTTAKLGKELYKYMADMFGGSPDRRSQMGNFWKLQGDDPVGFDYAVGDGTATWALWQKQRESMSVPFDSEGQCLEPVRALESRITRTIYRMSKRGIKIDEGRLHEVIHELTDKLQRAQNALPSGLNVRSSKDMKDLMVKAGHTDWPMTEPTKRFPDGSPSFTEAWLKGFKQGQDILAVRKYSNMLNSFAIPMRDRHIYRGRVHATFTQMANDEFGTVTGRFSSSEPNLQQVPKRNKEVAMLLRSFFVPDTGLDWIDADLAQCEPRLLAHYSGSKVLLEGYLSTPSVDAHSAVAKAAGIDREDGKRLNQTLITGGGRGKIIAMLGANGSQIYNDYFDAMPEVKRLQKNASYKMQQRGYVVSLKGRLARLENSSKAYLAINRLLQCGNADVIKEAMARIDEHFEACGDEVAMLNTVHDALAFQADMQNNDHVEQMNEALRIFTDYGPEGRGTYLRVPMAADFGIGRNWAEATFPEEKLVYGE